MTFSRIRHTCIPNFLKSLLCETLVSKLVLSDWMVHTYLHQSIIFIHLEHIYVCVCVCMCAYIHTYYINFAFYNSCCSKPVDGEFHGEADNSCGWNMVSLRKQTNLANSDFVYASFKSEVCNTFS